MASWTKFNSFVEALAEGVHDLGSDTLKLALTNTAPIASNTKLADLTEISSAGGYAAASITIASSSQSGGTYTLTFDDITFTASGADFDAFRYGAIYNDTAANKELVAWFDYGTAYTLADGQSFTVNGGTILTLA
jgi:hypothetical protein